MQRLGQLDLKNLLTTIVGAAIIGGGGFAFRYITGLNERVTKLEYQSTRIEDGLEELKRIAASKRK